MPSSPVIYVDADACPVKEEIYKVGLRHQTRIVVVANSYLRLPDHPLIERQIVNDSFDAADDYIAENASADAIIITADILLADRCIKTGAKVLAPNGKPFTEDSIGSAIAVRAIMADLRGSGDQVGGGPAPFSKQDRSRFLSSLDDMLVQLKRAP